MLSCSILRVYCVLTAQEISADIINEQQLIVHENKHCFLINSWHKPLVYEVDVLQPLILNQCIEVYCQLREEET